MRRKVYLPFKSYVQTANNGRQCCVRLHAAKSLTNEKFGEFLDFGTCFGFGKRFVPTSHLSSASKPALDLRMNE